MYQSEFAMPALLGAERYTTDEWAMRDQQWLASRSWQLMGVEPMVSRPGQQIVRNRFGIPVVLRNQAGEIVALSNVCAHRSCQMFDDGDRFAEELKCPYHGWRYGADGLTRKLPGAKNFPDLDRQRYRLEKYPIKRVGNLLFTYLGNSHEQANDRLGDWEDRFAERVNPKQWKFIFHDRIDYPCDWKIVIEGSLESYHLSEVHSGSLGEDPGEAASEHQFREFGSLFETRARSSSWLGTLEERGIRFLSGSFDPLYQHFHLFPGLMATMTDSMTLVYQIFPTGRAQSAIEFYGFSRQSENAGMLRRLIARWIAIGAEKIARQVLAEDAEIFPRVQQGMQADTLRDRRNGRILGRCEERIHAFQRYWKNQTQRETKET